MKLNTKYMMLISVLYQNASTSLVYNIRIVFDTQIV